MVITFLINTLDLALAAAPWLLLGLVTAGLVKAWLPTASLARRLGSADASAVATAALVGAPLPLCSCGVLPAAFALRRAGASKPATVSFLIATPETGIDSIAVSYVLLGPVFAVVRPIAAVLSALATGFAVSRLSPGDGTASKAIEPLDLYAQEDDGCGACCDADSQDPAVGAATGIGRRTFAGLRYAFFDLMDDIAVWLAVGIVVAGLIMTAVPPDLLAAWAQGPLAMLLVLGVSVPMYVCATASTPIALALIYAGVSPGTALVFLLAGPASNFAGLALVGRELGWRTMAIYIGGISLSALAAGLVLDAIWPVIGGGQTVPAAVGEMNDATPLWLAVPSLLVLGIVSLKPLRRALSRRLDSLALNHG